MTFKKEGNHYRNAKSVDERRGIAKKKVLQYVEGVMNMAAGGFGFVQVGNLDKTEIGTLIEGDIFIPQGKLRGALNNDKVKVAITKIKEKGRTSKLNTKSAEGEVVKIIERNPRPYVGLLSITKKQCYVIIENKNMPYDVEVPFNPSTPDGIKIRPEYQGLKVSVLVKDFPKGSLTPIGIVTDIIGKPGENDTEMHAILAEYGLPYKFPKEVEDFANKLPTKITQKDLEGRRDFRGTTTFTIDPADAKDFDDAVSVKLLDNGNYEIGVHIADVSYYVKPGTILDKEAYSRATSVYLVDRTIPMLPEALSNNLCSLRPNEDKLCFSAVFEIDSKAKVLKSWFGRTVICSSFRFAYEEAQQLIDSNGDVKSYLPILTTHPHPNSLGAPDVTGLTKDTPNQEVVDSLLILHKLASIMRKKRFAAGSISFERPEMKILVDDKGKPLSVVEKITKSANWLIEELMLLANKEVATFVTKSVRKNPPTFVYRVHDEPNMEKIGELRGFIHHFGYKMEQTANAKQLAKALNKLMDSVKDTPECDTIQLLALRCMARAEYSTDNIGHYGLGFKYYTHFTSPIRRYPDTMVHRLLARYLEGGKSADKQAFEEYCEHSSQREQLATEAERASIKYKMAEYMKERIGEIFEGVISGVTEWGIYVQAEPTKIEGMVPLREMQDDYFRYDEENMRIVGQTSGRVFSLGDRVKIRVSRVNLEQKTIDFELLAEEQGEDSIRITNSLKDSATNKKALQKKGTKKGRK